MRTRFLTTGVLLLALAGAAQAGQIDPFESCVNVNGAIYDVGAGCADSDGAAPGNVADTIETDTTAADEGLGSVIITLSEIGDFFIGMFVDWEVVEEENTFFDEDFGSGGTLAAGQSFEVDEPGYGAEYFGDIFEFNFLDGTLDNAFLQNSTTNEGIDSGNAPEDISLALGWNFSLAAGQTAVVSFLLSDTQPADGFWLSHSDPLSEFEFFFSSTLAISGGEPGPQPVPEPGTLFLLGAALLGARLIHWRGGHRV